MLLAILFVFGLCVGSFLNVLVDRLPHGESIIKKRSYCDHCKKTLRWYELIPVLSYTVFNGKCPRCHKKISIMYPLGEILGGLFFVLVAFAIGIENLMTIQSTFLLQFFYLLFIAGCLQAIFFTDVKYGIIPDAIVYPASAVALLYTAFFSPLFLWTHILCAVGAFVFFLVLFLVTKGKGMGLGDVKLVFLMGLFLGFPQIAVALYIAFLAGSVVAIALVLFRKRRFIGGTIPFGPFLVIGTGISYFFSSEIIRFIIHMSFYFS